MDLAGTWLLQLLRSGLIVDATQSPLVGASLRHHAGAHPEAHSRKKKRQWNPAGSPQLPVSSRRTVPSDCSGTVSGNKWTSSGALAISLGSRQARRSSHVCLALCATSAMIARKGQNGNDQRPAHSSFQVATGGARRDLSGNTSGPAEMGYLNAWPATSLTDTYLPEPMVSKNQWQRMGVLPP